MYFFQVPVPSLAVLSLCSRVLRVTGTVPASFSESMKEQQLAICSQLPNLQLTAVNLLRAVFRAAGRYRKRTAVFPFVSTPKKSNFSSSFAFLFLFFSSFSTFVKQKRNLEKIETTINKTNDEYNQMNESKVHFCPMSPPWPT